MAKLFDKSLITIQDKNGKLNLFALMMPIFLQAIINNMLGTINTAALSNYDSTILTAMNVSNRIIAPETTFALLAAAGLSIVLAQALGRNDKELIDNLMINALVSTVVIGAVLCGVALLLQGPLLSMFSLTGETLENAKIYFSIRQIGNMFAIISSCFSGALTARGKVTVVVIVGLVTSVLSVGSIFLFVNTPLGSFMPMIYNCAWLNVVVSFLALIAYAAFYFGFKYKIGRRINLKYIKRLFRIGVPSSIGSISYQMSMLISTMIISMLDVTLINVKIYCDSIFAFVQYLGYSIAQAGGVMGGRLIGAGDYGKVKQLYRQNFIIVLLANGGLAVLAFIFRDQLYMIFDRNPAHLALVLPIFLIDIIVELGRGTNHVNSCMLNAAGDVVFSTVVSVISCWICGVFLCYLFAIVLGWGLVGCWIAFAFDEWFRGVLCIIRWKTGKWQLKTV